MISMPGPRFALPEFAAPSPAASLSRLFSSIRLLVFVIFLASVSPPAASAAAAVMPGTLFGGGGADAAVDIAVLPSGDVVVAGNTDSASFPATSGAPAGGQDVWVARFSAGFESRAWIVRLGGAGDDQAVALAVDGAGAVYLAGNTSSADFPTTASAYDGSANGGQDAFLVKLDGASGALLYSSYLGGSGDEETHDLAVNAAGQAYVVGGTSSANFPRVAPLAPYAGGRDAFFSQFSTSGASLIFSSHYGSPAGGVYDEEARAVALDTLGNPYFAIYAADGGGFGLDHNRLLKLSGPSRAAVYDFAYGPQPPETADGPIRIDDLVIDDLGRALFAGTTGAASSLPLANAWQPGFAGGLDFFLARLDAGGTFLELSTYLGGEETEENPTLALGGDDSIFVAGASNSYDYPLLRPLDGQRAGFEGVVSRFGEDAQDLLSSTFFGGAAADRIAAVAVDAAGVALIAGSTFSPELPITGLLPGGTRPDGFAARLAARGIARFLPLRTVALGEPAQVPRPYAGGGADLDGDGILEEISEQPSLPLAASEYSSRRGDGRDLISVVLGTLGGVSIAGLADVDADGELELVVDDPSRDRGVFEGWLLDNRDFDVDLLVRGTGGDGGLLLADLDGDLENELVTRDPLSPDGAFEDLDNAEFPPDGDADVVFVGGRPRAVLDLDDDGEPELVAELVAGPSGMVVARDGVAGDDGDDDVIFVRGTYHFAADLDGDGRPELFFTPQTAAAAGSVVRNGQVLFLGGQPRTVADVDGDGRLELVAENASLPAGFSSQVAPGVVFLGGSFLGLADLDGDGELEILATSTSQAPGTYGLGIGLESPADLDPDIVFLPPGARGVADLDGDGELEVVAQNASLAAGTFSRAGGLEAVADADADVIFVGGELMLFADIDGDGETELAIRNPAAPAATAVALDGAESVADGDRDFVFMAGTARLAEDLDGDGESEVAADGSGAALTILRTLDAPGDGDADLVYVPGRVVRVADLDGDGEFEVVSADATLAAGAVSVAGGLEPTATPDSDADAIRVGGEPRQIGDIDGDGEFELVVEASGLSGVASTYLEVEGPGAGDADIVFVKRGAAGFADLDGDGDQELLVGDAEAAGPTGVRSVHLDVPSGSDTDILYFAGVLRLVGDLDGDGEPEALVEAAIPAATAFSFEIEAAPDGDPDLIFAGGRARGLADLDGDGEFEAVLETTGLTAGTATVERNLEGAADGDADLVFTGGVVQALADLDRDGEAELATTDARIAGGSSFYRRDLEPADDGDADVAFLGTGVVPGVRDPNGGEVWYIGSTQAIHWDLAGPGNVRIELSRDGGATWANLIGSTPNDGEQLWDVKGAPTNRALVRVTSRDNPAVTDTSDSTFTIPPAALTLLAPNGGETFQVGQHVEIAWSSQNLAGGIEVALSRNGGATWELIDATTPNDGSRIWTVSGPATTQAIFRVRSAVEHAIADSSDAAAGISGASLTVTSPNGGETLLVGSTTTLTWSSSGLAGAVHADLSRNGGATWERILTNTANDGNQVWNISGPATSQALVRLQSVSNPGISDVSDAVFSIPATSLAVTSPNGGETVVLASQVNLQWSSSGLGGNVRIDLSRDGGATWEVLFATTPNDGIQSWRVIGAPASQALLRVASRTEPGIADTSNTTFTIPPANLTVTSPNGGEVWTAGSTRTVTWTSTSLGGQVDIELSRDGGATWTTVVANTANDGTQALILPGPPTSQALIRVRSIHVAVGDSSNAAFTVQ